MDLLLAGSTSPASLGGFVKRALPCLGVSALTCALLAACNPALNWREVRAKDGSLIALFPCKAQASSRNVSLGGQVVEMTLNSCTADGALFVVGQATVSEAGAPVALTHWQRAALANISEPLANPANPVNKANPTTKESPMNGSPLKVAGVAGTPVLLSTQGKRADGSEVQFSGLWFSRGDQVFHAAIYADRIDAQMSEPFFNGLKLQ